MSDIKIQPSATGSGTVTITAPTTNTARVITLPDSAGTLLDENSSVPSANLTGTVVDARISALTASKLTGDLPAISGVNVTNVYAVNGGRKNIIINGDMQVAQRGTSSTSTGVKTVDRWGMGASVGATQSQLALTSGAAFDAGFRSAYKITNTGAISDTAGGYVSCFQYIEAQDLAKSGWNYTSSSNFITISFWIKSSIAGTYYVNPMSQDGTKKVYPQSFSLNANTWTKVEKTYAGVSGLEFANDTGRGMQLHISPFYGTNFTDSGVSTSAWSNYGSATRFPDYAQNWGASTGATWEITGVQLELGSTATDFEHRSYGEELALCQRYFEKHTVSTAYAHICLGQATSSTAVLFTMPFLVEKRVIPTTSFSAVGGFTAVAAAGSNCGAASAINSVSASPSLMRGTLTVGSGLSAGNATALQNFGSAGLTNTVSIDAEL